MAALAMTAKMKTNISSLIAKELAIALSKASFTIKLLIHVPGVMNSIADALSRLNDPNHKFEVPPLLANVPRARVEDRGPGFYKTASLVGCE